jgi:2-iminobutanoate/2-iminopropanoate deaminase
VAEAGDWLVVSGQLGVRDGALVPGGAGAQVAQALANMAALLGQRGAVLADVVKTTVFLTDMGDFQAMNAAYAGAFGEHRPARSAVAVAALPLGAAVEVEAWAYRPQRWACPPAADRPGPRRREAYPCCRLTAPNGSGRTGSRLSAPSI